MSPQKALSKESEYWAPFANGDAHWGYYQELRELYARRPDLDEWVRRLVLRGGICRGMTANAVKASLALYPPYRAPRVNRYDSGRTEQWVLRRGVAQWQEAPHSETLLYFTDGRLSGWQIFDIAAEQL